jgi:hypothetical protein
MTGIEPATSWLQTLADRGCNPPIGQVVPWVVVEPDDQDPGMMASGRHDRIGGNLLVKVADAFKAIAHCESVFGFPSRSQVAGLSVFPIGQVYLILNQGLVHVVAKCYHDVMSQPVKISDELILDARLTAEIAERSIAGQIEFWAQLGRAIEPLLEGSRALALRRAGAAIPLSTCLASVDSAAGRRRVAEYLESRPFPHYQAIPDSPGLLVRVDADGTRTVGRFVGRKFEAVGCP